MGTRMSIYMPDGLKKRMNSVRESVNWSAVACAAFERKLGEIAGRKKEKAMEDVIQRLKASKLENDSELYQQGREDGIEWAKHKATAGQLRRLSSLSERLTSDSLLSLVGSSPYGPGEHLVMCWLPENDVVPLRAAEFWESVAGHDWQALANEPEYVGGFAEGAIGMWEQVKNKI